MDKISFSKLQIAMSAYAKVNWFKYDELGGNNATGLFCTVNVHFKKTDSMERVKKLMKELEFPYTVDEKGMENTNHFEIRF